MQTSVLKLVVQCLPDIECEFTNMQSPMYRALLLKTNCQYAENADTLYYHTVCRSI